MTGGSRSISSDGLLAMLALAVTAGCTGVGATSSPTETSHPPVPTATPIASVAIPSPLLPIAQIMTADATVIGTLGTFTMDGSGSDAPWLPYDTLSQVRLGPRDTVKVAFVDGAAIGDWSAVVARSDDVGGATPRGVDGPGLVPDNKAVALGPLPVGRWVLEVRVFRADGRGNGLTFWAVMVE